MRLRNGLLLYNLLLGDVRGCVCARMCKQVHGGACAGWPDSSAPSGARRCYSTLQWICREVTTSSGQNSLPLSSLTQVVHFTHISATISGRVPSNSRACVSGIIHEATGNGHFFRVVLIVYN